MRRVLPALTGLIAFAGAACTEPESPVYARDILAPAAVELGRGDTSRHAVTVHDSAGMPIPRPRLTVTSSDPAIASVVMENDTTLRIVGSLAGSTEVTIAALGATRSLMVSVMETAATLPVTSFQVTLRPAGPFHRGQLMVAYATLRSDTTRLKSTERYVWSSSNPTIAGVIHAAGDSAVFAARETGSFNIHVEHGTQRAGSWGLPVHAFYPPPSSPQQVTAQERWLHVAATGNGTCAIALGGEVYCWGTAPTGKFVDQRFTPERQDFPSPATQLSVSVPNVCVITTADGLRCRGTPEEFGTNGGWPKGPSADAQAMLRSAMMAATGGLHGCVLDASQVAWCWGNDEWGQTGVADPPSEACMATGKLYLCYYSPQQVTSSARFTQLVAGNLFTCGLATDGLTYCWGGGTTGQPASTTCAYYPGHGSPQPPHYCNPVPAAIPGTSESPHVPPQFARLFASGARACAVTAGGDAFCWDARHTLPERVGKGHSYVAVAPGNAHTCGVTTTGTVVCWGRGAEGQLGRALPASEAPVEVALPAAARAVTSGSNHSCAILTTDALYCWGASDLGQLGVGPGVPPEQ